MRPFVPKLWSLLPPASSEVTEPLSAMKIEPPGAVVVTWVVPAGRLKVSRPPLPKLLSSCPAPLLGGFAPAPPAIAASATQAATIAQIETLQNLLIPCRPLSGDGRRGRRSSGQTRIDHESSGQNPGRPARVWKDDPHGGDRR
jgi:hypothetical protein